MKDRIRQVTDLALIPGLPGHQDRVHRHIAELLSAEGIASRSDRLGNLIARLDGDPAVPSVMVFTHMDQLGFFARKIEDAGLIRVERLGGAPERALAGQSVLLCVGEGRECPASSPTRATTCLAPCSGATDQGFL